MAKRAGQALTKAEQAKWPEPLPGRCNFRKRDYTRCGAWPVKPGTAGFTDFTHCAKHQRAQGDQVHTWKGGRSEGFMRRYMPERLLARYDAVVNDPELTSVRELIAVTGARMTELLEKIPRHESGEAWDAMLACIRDLDAYTRQFEDTKTRDQFTKLLDRMRSLYDQAATERSAWGEFFRTAEQARRLADTERKREEMLQANLTAQQATALFSGMFQIFAEEVHDLQMRRRLGVRIMALLEKDKAKTLMPGEEVHAPE